MNKNIIAASILGVFFIPILFVLEQIASGLFEHFELLSYLISNQFFDRLYHSIALSFGVGIVSILLALLSTFSFFSIKQLYLRQILFLLLFIFFSISPIIYLTALSKIIWFNQLNIYIQAISVLSIKFFSLATMIFVFCFARVDALSIKIALMHSSLVNALKYIIFPQLYKPIVSAFLIVFMLTFIHEEVPSFLGYRTYAEDFLSHMVVMNNIKEVSFMSIPFLLLGFLILKVSAKTVQSYIHYNNNTSIYIFPNFQKFAFLQIFIFSFIILFISFLLFKGVAGINIVTSFMDNFNALKNSFLVSFITSILGLIISLFIYPFIYHSSLYTKTIFSLLMLLSWLLPSSLTSLSIVELSIYLNQYNIVIGYALLIFAYLVKILPIAFLLLVSFKVIEVSDIFLQLQNISKINIFKYISIPLEWTKWFVLVIILNIFSLNELSSTILLIPPGEETIIVKIYNLMHYGDFSSVAFLSLLQIGLVLMFIIILGYLLRKQYDYA